MSYHRVSHSLRICSGTVVGHLGHVAVVVVDVVVDVLDASVRESHGVGTLGVTCAVTGLGSIEVRVGVVVSNGVLVGVGRDLVRVDLSMVGRGSMSNHGGVVGRGSMDHRGVVGRGSVDYRSVVGRGSMDHRSSMVDSVDNRGSMVDSMVDSMDRSSMSHNSMRSSMVTSYYSTLSEMCGYTRLSSTGHRIMGSHRGDGGAEGLGLTVAPDLTLVGLGYGLVGDLTTSIAVSQELGGGGSHKGGTDDESLHVCLCLPVS